MRTALWMAVVLMVGACAADEPAPVADEIIIGPIGGGGQCGSNVCGKGTFCCNSSCGVCAPIGGACLDVYCEPTEEQNMSVAEREELIFVGGLGGQQCGYVTCGKGQHCCNASCSRCVPFGVQCTQETCD